MVTKFDRIQISSVNSIQTGIISKVKGGTSSESVAVPQKDTFKHIFENAKKGNEMAAVLLDEWQKNCQPKDNEEMKVIHMINMAANRIFK